MANVPHLSWASVGLLMSASFAFTAHPIPLLAAPSACSDRQAIDFIQKTAAREFNSILPLFMGGQTQEVTPKEFSVNDTYTLSQTDNVRYCTATLLFLQGEAGEASTEVHYEVIMTDEGNDLFKWQKPQDELGPLAKSVMLAKKPSDEALRDYYAPQGPGSFADQTRKYNREGSSGARKSPPRE